MTIASTDTVVVFPSGGGANVVSFTDLQSQFTVDVPGPVGPPGPAGVGVASAALVNNVLNLTLTNGTTIVAAAS